VHRRRWWRHLLIMAIHPLTPNDLDSYLAFRHEMWPTHPAAGDWEIVHEKYFQHPHAAQCPGAGLYAYSQGRTIAGIMGAYPMPVTLDGTVYAGHMLVDWGVLPRFRHGPAAGRLFEALLALPGRKYASQGTRDSQGPLERRALRIPAVEAIAVLTPVQAAVIRLFHLGGSAQAAPVPLDDLSDPGRVDVIGPHEVTAPTPPNPERTAYVSRGPEFWLAYCVGRVRHGGVAVRIRSPGAEATAVVRLLQIGTLRLGVLLAVQFGSLAAASVRGIAASFRTWLKRLGVAVLIGTAADDSITLFFATIGRVTLKSSVQWWAIRRPSDTFGATDVKWWLTSADRDTQWGCVEPSQALRRP
jgi:hypothetical protein